MGSSPQNKRKEILFFFLITRRLRLAGFFLFYKGQKRGKNVVNVCKTM
nr:MAG TPA: hypothetical protein [Caudoviricetes sp.]